MVKPVGNPNIGNERKTGPLTDIGKLKSVMSATKVTGLRTKHETALLKRIRVCNKCPLGEKLITMKVGDKIIKRTKPAECSFYEKDKTECVVPVSEWIETVDVFWQMQGDTFELQKTIIIKALQEAETAKQFETIKKGHGGFYAKEWTDMGLKYLTEYNKLISGVGERQLHHHGHQEKGDMAERIVNKVFEDEKEEKDGTN